MTSADCKTHFCVDEKERGAVRWTISRSSIRQAQFCWTVSAEIKENRFPKMGVADDYQRNDCKGIEVCIVIVRKRERRLAVNKALSEI